MRALLKNDIIDTALFIALCMPALDLMMYCLWSEEKLCLSTQNCHQSADDISNWCSCIETGVFWFHHKLKYPSAKLITSQIRDWFGAVQPMVAQFIWQQIRNSSDYIQFCALPIIQIRPCWSATISLYRACIQFHLAKLSVCLHKRKTIKPVNA